MIYIIGIIGTILIPKIITSILLINVLFDILLNVSWVFCIWLLRFSSPFVLVLILNVPLLAFLLLVLFYYSVKSFCKIISLIFVCLRN